MTCFYRDKKKIEGVLWRKQRIASESGFPLELAVCAVSHLLSPAVAEKQPSKRNICSVRNEDYITVQDATTSPYQKPRSTGCDAANPPVQKWHHSLENTFSVLWWHASNNGIWPQYSLYLFLSLWVKLISEGSSDCRWTHFFAKKSFNIRSFFFCKYRILPFEVVTLF